MSMPCSLRREKYFSSECHSCSMTQEKSKSHSVRPSLSTLYRVKQFKSFKMLLHPI